MQRQTEAHFASLDRSVFVLVTPFSPQFGHIIYTGTCFNSISSMVGTPFFLLSICCCSWSVSVVFPSTASRCCSSSLFRFSLLIEDLYGQDNAWLEFVNILLLYWRSSSLCILLYLSLFILLDSKDKWLLKFTLSLKLLQSFYYYIVLITV